MKFILIILSAILSLTLFFVYNRYKIDADSKIHASIIKFNGKGMLLPIWDFPKYLLFLHRNRLSTNPMDDLWK